jgi:hypothetical protein
MISSLFSQKAQWFLIKKKKKKKKKKANENYDAMLDWNKTKKFQVSDQMA